ncbi:MAG: LysR substrate-binding domain-containing protein [Proteobacteria bacterium]|nr:LysR substrate-binding domain-containing protein [Pseudomonadota bacterium]
MTLRQIEAFRAVMITGSITKAASELHVSQPAVSRILADLEDSIGFKLFARINRTMIPTDEGRAFFEDVERSFTGLEELKRSAQAIGACFRGRVRVIFVPGVGSKIIADVIEKFKKENPEIAVTVEVEPSQRLFELVATKRFDVGISTTLPTDMGSIKVRRCAQGSAVCILPRGHRLSKQKTISPQDLEGESFISFCSDSIARNRIDAEFIKAEVTRELQIEARTTSVIISMVESGLGVSIIGPVFDLDRVSEHVEVRPFRPKIHTDLVFLYPTAKPESLITKRFTHSVGDYLRSYFSSTNEFLDDLHWESLIG